MTTISNKKTYQIPFDENDNMLSYGYSYGGRQINFKDNYIFSAAMKYIKFGRGRSAATMYLQDVATGKMYPMFLSTFDELLKSPGHFAINSGTGELIFTGPWTFCKKGANYALILAKQ